MTFDTGALSRRGVARVVRSWVEHLEFRRLLCGLPHSYLDPAPAFDPQFERSAQANSGSGDAVSIVWTNRGVTSGASDDRFTATFGANAAAARSAVDAVLADWARAITSWNRTDGTTTLQVAISMASSGTGFGAAAGPSGSSIPADGKPRSGSISIGRGNDTTGDGIGDGGGWYIDPTPTDSAEFTGNTLNAFAGYQPTSAGNDLYTVTSLELTHVLGLISGPTGSAFNSYRLMTSGYATTLATPDTAEAGSSNTGSRGYYAKFDGPTIDHLMTTNNGGGSGSDWGAPIHTAGGAASLVVNSSTWVGGEDSGNAGYDSARYLPNEVVLRMLADAYGYSIQDPTTLPNLHSILNTSTGVLTIRGGAAANSADVISVTQVGTKLRVSVDIGTDVAGSGALPGAGNLPAYVSEYDLAVVNSVRVYGFDGNDTITVDGADNTTVYGGLGNDSLRAEHLSSGVSVTLDGEQDNDNLYVGYNNNLDFIDGTLNLQGNTGTDSAWFEDSFSGLITSYTLNSTSLARSGMSAVNWTGVDAIHIDVANAGANFNVRAVTMPTTIQGGNGSDAFLIGNASNTIDDIDAPLIAIGGGSIDSFEVNDSGYLSPPVYTITGNTIARAGMTAATFNGVESFILTGTGATDEFHVASTGYGTTYRIYGGANSDRLYVGDGTTDRLDPIDGSIIFDGQGGSSDEANFWDDDESTAGTYTLNENMLLMGRMAGVTLVSTEEGYVEGSSGNDTFSVWPSTVIAWSMWGNGGTDSLEMNNAGATSPTHIPTSSTAGTWTFGNRKTVAYNEIENISQPGVNNPPTIGSLSASSSSVTQGTTIVLTANNVADSDGSVLTVYFYRENNGIAGFQTDDLLFATDSTAGDGYTAAVATGALPAGTYTFYARAGDNGNAYSNTPSASAAVTVPTNLPPTISSLSDSVDPVVAGNAFRLTANGVSDPEGAMQGVSFYRETNGVAGLQIGADQLLATDNSAGDGWYTDVNTIGMAAATYTYYALARDTAAQPSNVVSATNTVTNPPGPTPYYYQAFLEQAPLRVFFMFLQDVGASLDPTDMTVRNLATNQSVGVNAVTWDSANRAAVFSLATIPADGNYRATLSGTGISANGIPMGTNVDVDFFILRGDANHDRVVNFDDLLILAQNYGGSNKSFSQGNFNFDAAGLVNFDDLLILSQKYGSSLLASGVGTMSSIEIRRKARTASDVLA